jgi:MFS superfamily sulfate permease-like transporter
VSLKVDKGTTFDKFLFLLEHIGEAHKLTTILSVVTLAVLVTARIFKPRLVAGPLPFLRFVPDVALVVVITTGAHACTLFG